MKRCAQSINLFTFEFCSADILNLREQKLQEFLSNAAKSGSQADAAQSERSDVTVAALLGGVKRRGDVADEGEAA